MLSIRHAQKPLLPVFQMGTLRLSSKTTLPTSCTTSLYGATPMLGKVGAFHNGNPVRSVEPKPIKGPGPGMTAHTNTRGAV